MGDYDELGYDELGYDELGAAMVRRAPPRRPAVIARNPAPRGNALRTLFEDQRGEGVGSMLRDFPCPLTTGQFTVAVTTLLLTAQPQRYFLGRRVVVDLGRVGASAIGLVNITSITVGVDPQQTNTGSIPANAFGPTAVGTGIKFKAAKSGDVISMGLTLTGALAGADVINVSAVIFGAALD